MNKDEQSAKFEFTKEQYEDLLIMSGIANSVLGILGDALPDTDYKKRSDRMERLEENLLGFADDFDCAAWTQKYEGRNIFNDEMYEKQVTPIMNDYNEHERFDGLANELAWRDFHLDHTEAQMREMEKKNGDYFGVALYDYEKKYWDEFEQYGFDRLIVVETPEIESKSKR